MKSGSATEQAQEEHYQLRKVGIIGDIHQRLLPANSADCLTCPAEEAFLRPLLEAATLHESVSSPNVQVDRPPGYR